MNLIDAGRTVRYNARAGISTLLVSGSGMGKSQKLWAEAYAFKADCEAKGLTCGHGQIFMATQTPPDFIGYQFKGEKIFDMGNGEKRSVVVTEASCPLWMISTEGKPAWMYDRFFLIIDEYGQGDLDTKRCGAEIFLNHGTAGAGYLPQGSVVTAASNEGSRYGVNKDFDFCVTRRSLIRIHGDPLKTVEHFDVPYDFHGRKWRVMPVVRNWAARHPEFLFEKEPEEQGPWGNPRAICAASRFLDCVAEDNNGTIPYNDSLVVENLQGIMGPGATMSLCTDLAFLTEIPSKADVVADPDNCPVPEKADLKLLMIYQLAGYAEPDEINAITKYLKRLKAKDMEVTFVSSLLRRDYKAFINLPALQAWINQNSMLITVVGSLSR
jgi:hypothetical protein